MRSTETTTVEEYQWLKIITFSLSVTISKTEEMNNSKYVEIELPDRDHDMRKADLLQIFQKILAKASKDEAESVAIHLDQFQTWRYKDAIGCSVHSAFDCLTTEDEHGPYSIYLFTSGRARYKEVQDTIESSLQDLGITCIHICKNIQEN